MCARDGEPDPADACRVCVARDGAPVAAAWTPRASGTVCRPSAGPCDVAEACAGGACPADGFARVDTLCRASRGPCDRVEVCSGAGAACPDDALTPASTVCHASTSVASCDPAEVCNGRDATCPADVVTRTARAEACGDGLDDNCNGAVDEGSTPCIAGSASGSPWQIHRVQGPVCFGRSFSQHGEAGEYELARVPASDDAGWAAVTSATIDFAETSALCGRECTCLNGGEFTYFQTFFDVTPGYAVTSPSVTMSGVDDGARVSVYNST